MVTPQLRETFYYPRGMQWVDENHRKDVEPIAYSLENHQKTLPKN
jgi:hypothetical protein